MIPKISRDQVEQEARAKILWGEEPISVLAYIRSNGYSLDEARALMAEFEAERKAEIRGDGIKNIVIGCSCIAVPVIAWLICMMQGVLYVKAFALTVCVGLWGLWKVGDGVFKLVNPSSQTGDLSDQSD